MLDCADRFKENKPTTGSSAQSLPVEFRPITGKMSGDFSGNIRAAFFGGNFPWGGARTG